jgi:hypothetical protein
MIHCEVSRAVRDFRPIFFVRKFALDHGSRCQVQDGVMVTCALCGKTEDEQPLTWSTSVERGGIRVYCEQCSRDNVRGIESKLDQDWW